MKNISVIGAGTMGNGIAHTFALAGYQVKLIDINQERLNLGLQTIEKNLDRQVSKGIIGQEQMQQTLNRISLTTEIRTGVSDSDLVVEAATEKLELKLEIFKTIDQSAPEQCILATNTSSISITQIAGVTSRPSMVIGMHFMNPVPIMKLVEVIRGYSTSDKTTKLVMDLSKDLGKIPTEVNDYPGFIANRILMPMINEAIESLFQGVAGVNEIDTVMKLGMAHPMGPLELADFIGLDVCLSILEVMYEGFKNPKYAPCPLLVNMVRSGNLGKKSGSGFYDYAQERKAVIVSQQFQ
ncbi:3-hydroxybutyryl-CoA dehydrogenase [Flavobacteriaceae bacterium]|nr:3-hydroxybutyryl-CoA dehydrogenase [Flavobacteriaceae bacterium]